MNSTSNGCSFFLHAAYATHLKRLTTMMNHLKVTKRTNVLPPTFTFLFLLLFSVCTYSQEMSITGKITDSLGNGVPDVTIAIKGTAASVKTNAQGDFKLMAGKGAVLKISHINYTGQEVKINSDAPVSIVLQQAATSLDDVVVVGYGTMKKKDLTGSIVQVKPDRIANENPKTVQDILRGT